MRTIYEHENGDVTLLENGNEGYDLSGETGCHGRGTDLLYHGPDADMRPFDSALDPNDFLDCQVIGTVRDGERPGETVVEIHPDRAGAQGRLVLGIAPGGAVS